MHNYPLTLFSAFLISVTLCHGCGTPAPARYSHAVVRTYAELLVFHEKEKMIGMLPDSLYERKVKDFFAERKINQEEFRNQIAQISGDDAAWRAFLSEATAAVDSIKAAKPS